MTPKQATIGDALIFATKAIVGGIVLIVLVGIGALSWAMRGDRVASLESQNEEQQVTIADLGGKLNTCLAAAMTGPPSTWPEF